jgi:hypothetical protein
MKAQRVDGGAPARESRERVERAALEPLFDNFAARGELVRQSTAPRRSSSRNRWPFQRRALLGVHRPPSVGRLAAEQPFHRIEE